MTAGLSEEVRADIFKQYEEGLGGMMLGMLIKKKREEQGNRL